MKTEIEMETKAATTRKKETTTETKVKMKMTTFLKQVYGEAYILLKCPTIKWIIGISIVVLSFFLKEAVDLRYSDVANYYTTQLLLSIVVVVIFFPILIGGFIGSKDYEWRTWGAKLLPISRKRIVIIKLCVIFGVSVLITVIGLIIGLFYDTVHQVHFSEMVFYRALSTIYVCFFWGTLAFLIGMITKNFALSAIIPFSYLFFEPILYTKMNSTFLSWLPFWNQRSFLQPIFRTNDGVIIIPNFDYNPSWVGFGIFTAYFLVTCLLLFYIVRRKEFV